MGNAVAVVVVVAVVGGLFRFGGGRMEALAAAFLDSIPFFFFAGGVGFATAGVVFGQGDGSIHFGLFYCLVWRGCC